MKTNFKYVMMAAALSMGFASCSNDNENEVVPPVNANEHSVKVKINVASATSRGLTTEGTAVGKTPNLNDLTLFFVDETLGKVTHVEAGNPIAIKSTGQTVSALPGGTNALYIVGNLGGAASSSISAISATSSEAELKKALIDVKAQYGVGTPTYENVNLFGYSTYTLAPDDITGMLALDICPAISRLEIAQVEADPAAAAADLITSFDLAGIFINNTYAQIGIDNTIYPTNPADIIAYPNTDPIWATPTGYPSEYCIPSVGTGATSYTSGGTNKWAFYIAPAAKQVAGDYVGEAIASVQYDAKPVIVLKLENVNYGPAYTGPNPQGGTAFITIVKLKDGVSYIDHFERGKVYEIANIKFDASNVTVEPMTPPIHSLDVTVTVKPWTGVTTEPEF